ncbi:MAG: bifunctional riboflavin kinase/FAD synthetase [Candidatus Marinimicrobia bacterium]|nr:bifunctional riboflavin kinase/FAD synthetase [Candidatus Neomarinimicrobiota bacterium]
MEIFRSLDLIENRPDCYLTIGSFDGLHRGHQEIIKKVVAYAHTHDSLAVVISFDPHPQHVLNPAGERLPLLLSISKKLKIMERLNVDQAVVLPFTTEFSRITATKFLENIILNKFNPTRVVIGNDHHFGYGREGSPAFIKSQLSPRRIDVEVVDPVHDENVIISSTHIRELIKAGFVRRASFELGWVYGFDATVVAGVGRGRSLLFPTANFIPLDQNQLLPGQGVYFTRGRLNSKNIYGMCNLGTRPTFDEGGFVMEVHFFEKIDEELYGRQITVEFLERIRDEKKFDSAEALIEQLEEDKHNCFELLSKYK